MPSSASIACHSAEVKGRVAGLAEVAERQRNHVDHLGRVARRLRSGDPVGQLMQGTQDIAFVDSAVAVHDPYGQDPGIGCDLAHDARDERAVAGVRGKLAQQRIGGDRRVPWMPDHLARLVAERLRGLVLRADGVLNVMIELDETVAVPVRVGVVAAANFGRHIQPRVGPDARVQDGDHRTPAVHAHAVGRRPARWRIEQDGDRGTRVAAAEQVGVSAGGPGAVVVGARAPADAAPAARPGCR